MSAQPCPEGYCWSLKLVVLYKFQNVVQLLRQMPHVQLCGFKRLCQLCWP